MADVIQQMRAEVNEANSGGWTCTSERVNKTSRIQAIPVTSIQELWKGSNEKGKFRSFMSGLHLWMQAWSNQGEKRLASVESIDKFDTNAIAFDCSDEEFR